MKWLWKSGSLAAAGAFLLSACATLPNGPSVMVMPGHGKSFRAFQADDATCRSWAAQQTGIHANRAAARSGATSAAVGTAVGAAAGAALGAAAGRPATGAAIGAGSGLLLGSASGAGAARYAGAEAQRRYDGAYMQCMVAKGNQIPMAGHLMKQRYSGVPQHRRHPLRASRDSPSLTPPPGPPPPPPPEMD